MHLDYDKRTMKKFLIIYVLFAFGMLSGEPLTLSFQQLHPPVEVTENTVAFLKEQSAFHGQTVNIRGFLYQEPEGQWILASEPNLKTCCIGTSKKVTQQIFLSAPFTAEALRHAVTVKGDFVIKPIWNKDGSLHQLYQLDNPILLSSAKIQWSWPTVGLIVFAISFIGWIFFTFRFKYTIF